MPTPPQVIADRGRRPTNLRGNLSGRYPFVQGDECPFDGAPESVGIEQGCAGGVSPELFPQGCKLCLVLRQFQRPVFIGGQVFGDQFGQAACRQKACGDTARKGFPFASQDWQAGSQRIPAVAWAL